MPATPSKGVKASVWKAISGIAAQQCGAVSVAQLRAAGLSRRAQAVAVDAGLLALPEPRVAVLCSAPATWHRSLWVGTLALNERGWVSHLAAARLHEFDRFDHDNVDFTVCRNERGLRLTTIGSLHTTSSIGRLDVVTIGGLRVSSATRTIIDLAALGIAEILLGAAIDTAVRGRVSAPAVINRRLGELRGPGRRGVRLLDAVLLDAGGETELERRFLALLRRVGLPRPLTQVVCRANGRHVARVDFLFAELGVVVEVSGQHGHSAPRERAHDAQRRNELLDLGHVVYEYTWGDLTTRPRYVADTMGERLIRAGWAPKLNSVR